VLSGLGH